MDNVLNTSKTNQALLESLLTHLSVRYGDNRPILQPAIEVPDLSKKHCVEAIDAVTEEIWKLLCWGRRDSCHSLFTFPYLTAVQRTFFVYRYLLHDAEVSPFVAKWHMEKTANGAVTDTSPLRKPPPKYPSRSKGPPRT